MIKLVLNKYLPFSEQLRAIIYNSNEAEQEEVTTWMDENIYKGKIKFEMKCNTKELKFLDTKVTLRPGKENGDEESRVYLVPAMYSKPKDTQQYLNPNSCHSPHITGNLPSSIVSRIRRNCSNNCKDDKILKETLIEYKAYMYLMKSAYKKVHID